jgi:catechol 2,3-dioxygenase-like lactoylglutathione lyase family enzyme
MLRRHSGRRVCGAPRNDDPGDGMIDHVSIAVRDLAAGAAFYETVLAPLGYARLVDRPDTVGFGKKYPEFWLNHRPAMAPAAADTGAHVCLRARDAAAVDAFHAAAVRAGAACDGAPGPRQGAMQTYYAAFVRDADGNKLEVATFVPA